MTNTPKKEWGEQKSEWDRRLIGIVRSAKENENFAYELMFPPIINEIARYVIASRDEALIAQIENLKVRRDWFGTPHPEEAVNKTLDKVEALIRGSRET